MNNITVINMIINIIYFILTFIINLFILINKFDLSSKRTFMRIVVIELIIVLVSLLYLNIIILFDFPENIITFTTFSIRLGIILCFFVVLTKFFKIYLKKENRNEN